MITVIYTEVEFRVPKSGDRYLSKTGEVLKCKQTNYSKNASKKIIVNYLRTEEVVSEGNKCLCPVCPNWTV